MIKITQLISLLMTAATCLIPAQGLQLQGAVWEAFPSPGDSLQYAMKVNLSQEESPTLITASVMNCSQDGQGTLLEESSSSSLSPPSAQPWISLRLSNQSSQEGSKTLSFNLQPGESREIIASAQIPQEESLQGGRYALIKFLSSPQQVNRHKMGQVQTQLATDAFVSFDLGYEEFAAEIPELSYIDGNLSMQLSNIGNMHFKPRILIETGSISKDLPAENQPSILPGASRWIKLPLGLEPGSHEIKAQIFRNEVLLAEKQISAEA